MHRNKLKKCYEKTLDGLQLKDWAKYEKQIQCSTDFENEGQDPVELIDKVF